MYQQGGQKERMDKSWSAARGCDWWLECGLAGGVTGEWPQEDQHGSHLLGSVSEEGTEMTQMGGRCLTLAQVMPLLVSRVTDWEKSQFRSTLYWDRR